MRAERRRRGATVLGIVLAAATALVACAPEPGGSARPTRDAPPTASPTPVASPTPSPFPEGVIGRGAFASPDGAVSGSLEVLEHDDDRVTFRISDLEGVPDDASVLLRPGSQERSSCADVDVVDYGPVSYVPDGSQRPVDLARPFNDPTVWKAVVVAVPGDPQGEGCTLTVIAAAPIEWGIEPLRPELAVVSDGGERPGAEGGVSTAGGRIYAYLVAPGDVLSIVAERFGMRVADVLALNPFRADPLDTGLYADEVLNLSLDLR